MLEILCRDCGWTETQRVRPSRCRSCGSPSLLGHPELKSLSIAHIDCDAFYASVEKRDDPGLRDRPVIIGGGTRGVVSTCCYIARQFGVHSAMPMFTAKKLCPDAVVIKPNMSKYVEVSREIRRRMDQLTPLVQPLSIDEAFLDLSGTEALHRASPAEVLGRFAREIASEIGVTVSVGLSHNKFLAKVASDLDKPRGFTVIGSEETETFLAGQPVSIIFGVGKVFADKLQRDGFETIGQLQQAIPEDLMRRYGETGARLARLARGDDSRPVSIDRDMKTISSETTFNTDLAHYEELSTELLALCERLSQRIKDKGLVGDTVTLKLKTTSFRSRTRARHLSLPTQLSSVLYDASQQLLSREMDGTSFRLIGVGLSGLSDAGGSDPTDLLEPQIARKAAAERAMDKVRSRFGSDAVIRGSFMADARHDDTKTLKRARNDHADREAARVRIRAAAAQSSGCKLHSGDAQRKSGVCFRADFLK